MVKDNLKLCPFLKIKKIEIERDSTGKIIKKSYSETYNDCQKYFCMAWNAAAKQCAYFQGSLPPPPSINDPFDEQGLD